MIKQSTRNNKCEDLSPIARIFVKPTNAVVYQYRATESNDVYCTTVVNGKATGCSCTGNAIFHRNCKHMKHAVALEIARQRETMATIAAVAERQATRKPIDLATVRQLKDAYAQLSPAVGAEQVRKPTPREEAIISSARGQGFSMLRK